MIKFAVFRLHGGCLDSNRSNQEHCSNRNHYTRKGRRGQLGYFVWSLIWKWSFKLTEYYATTDRKYGLYALPILNILRWSDCKYSPVVFFINWRDSTRYLFSESYMDGCQTFPDVGIKWFLLHFYSINSVLLCIIVCAIIHYSMVFNKNFLSVLNFNSSTIIFINNQRIQALFETEKLGKFF